MRVSDVKAGKSRLPAGVTCTECAALGWTDCGTARDIYCVASDQGPYVEDVEALELAQGRPDQRTGNAAASATSPAPYHDTQVTRSLYGYGASCSCGWRSNQQTKKAAQHQALTHQAEVEGLW